MTCTITTSMIFSLLLLIAGSSCHASPGGFVTEEVYRIRIENEVGGLVQVSMDGGIRLSAVGRVNAPANARITGFAAASYTPHGTVAAVAVHGLRIKTGQSALGVGKAQLPLMFSVIPAEFARIPNGYGGHIARSSGILTDIHAGHSIFRNQSPYVGNLVYVERDHKLLALPEDYIPVTGETFVIVVKRPVKMPSEIDFENRAGGKVTAVYPDGTTELIAGVDRPVKGTGRYDGTTFTGVGAINTNHGGVITISTAPTCLPSTREGGPVETRGGFMIQPYYHVTEQGESSPQVMVVGPKDASHPVIEGTPPLFEGYINLSRWPSRPQASYRAQVRIDGGDWEDVPKIIGRVDDSFTAGSLETLFAKSGKPRRVMEGVTAVRILFPEYDMKLVAADLAREASDCAAGAGPVARVKGSIILTPARLRMRGCMVSYYLNGTALDTSNDYPYEFLWNTRQATNGLHTLEIETQAASGGNVVVEKRRVLVAN